METPWWFGPYQPEVPLSDDQQLVVHCWFSFTKDADKVNAAVSDFPSYLRQQLDDALERTGDEMSRQLLAAGLLTYGQLGMVDVILDNVPPGLSQERATGYCAAAPANILSRLLPLPDALKTDGVHSLLDWDRVREWFESNRHQLEWDAANEQFRLVTREPT